MEVLALLAHPLARFGRPRAEVVDLARTLEIAILRGVLPPRALHDPAGLVERARLASRERHAPDPLRRLDEGAFRRLATFLGDVVAALGPLHRLGADTPLPDWLAAHAAVIDAIAVDPEGNSVLTGVDGHALTTLFETFAEAPEAGITLDCAGYGALFDRFCAETPVRGPNRSHPRVKILGLLEARLLSADLVLLGGLDETVWPPQSETDAFLNRPMRASLGLSPPERRIGQTAHDLVMLMGQPRVILSRARKRGGTPTVPSRFLLRMQALAGERWAAVQARGTRYTDLAATLDKPERSITIPRPNPKPPVDLRPTGLSVTRIETLRRDPYSIYADRILKLRPAEPIGALMGPRDYGTTFHGVLRDAALAFGTEPRPADAAERLAALTETAFAAAQADVPFRTFHWPRIQGWARAYLTWDADRRMDHLLIEQQGAIDIPLDDGSSFRLTANADRIEASGDGRVTVIDYKTGRSPSLAQVKVGFSPQLTLEAAMVEKGGFAELGSGARVEGAAYVKFGTGEAVEDRPLAWKDAAFPDVVARALRWPRGLAEPVPRPRHPLPPTTFSPIRQRLRRLRPPRPCAGMVHQRRRRLMSVQTRPIPADTLDKQRRAADPAGSAWVSANAGSGKTFVLTRRVVRLLLDGTAPSRILCLTFTKAAAATMAIKVFETLAKWVTLDDSALTAAIVETGAPRPTAETLAQARRLFARTVETPGGLKILTIHAFCEKLLHRFPFEANVPARFAVIEEVRQQELLTRAQEAVLASAVARPETAVGAALGTLARDLSNATFAALVRELAGHFEALRETIDEAGGPDGLVDALRAALGVDDRGVLAIERAMLEDGLPRSEWDSVGRHLVSRSPKGSATGDRLILAAAAPEPLRLALYCDVVLTQRLEPRADTYLPKALRTAEPDLCARLDAERQRLGALLQARRAATTVERTVALVAVAGAVLDEYTLTKRRRGLLDFADLIVRTRHLLARSDAAWVLYKLDSGIDHVLVDEAQDTSPEQWEILDALTRDFFAGAGQSTVPRSFFAVGDEKQSIYSFQGARPAMFEAARADYAKRAEQAGQRFARIDLHLSFRSVTEVLAAVDGVFAHADNARGLSAGSDGAPPHEALKRSAPGLLEIWPAIGPQPKAEPPDWRLPLDLPQAHDPATIVAERVAGEIKRLTAVGSGESVEDRDGRRRPVRPGDVLILVRTRSAFFEAVIRALKARGIPVAGADRLALTSHIATMDLAAAGRAALLPDDDLTLACLLKSPLIGFDDDDLLRLAPGRTGSLEAALRDSDLPRDRTAAAQLGVWRDRAASLTPFAFYTRLLGPDGGRKKMLARLGPEAADVLDEFLALTLAHERDGAPSLLAFLARLEGVDVSIKRDLEAASDAVRVMTVHAAKGLEAKIVFLPDTCGMPTGKHDPKLFRLDPERSGAPALLAWSPRADEDADTVADRREATRDAALDEYRRLLYVAMTRAEERLYIAGFHGERGPPAGCWYEMIIQSALEVERVPAPWDAAETVLRRGDAMPPPDAAPAPAPTAPTHPPDWLFRAAPVETPVAPPIRPSTALGAADRGERAVLENERGPGASQRRAALIGRLAHRLLQHLPSLPVAERRAAAQRFLARQGGTLTDTERDRLVDETVVLVADTRLAALFGPGSRAEVAIAGTVQRAGFAPLPVIGHIDRVGVTDDAVLIADFKTGTPRPLVNTPPGYITQLALYRAVLTPLYPGRSVRAFLVWTAGPAVVELDAATLDTALSAVGPA